VSEPTGSPLICDGKAISRQSRQSSLTERTASR
jgi:hypothetical protein